MLYFFAICGSIQWILIVIFIVMYRKNNSWKKEMDKVLRIIRQMKYPYKEKDKKDLEKALDNLPMKWHYLSLRWMNLNATLFGSFYLKSYDLQLKTEIEKIQADLHLKD